MPLRCIRAGSEQYAPVGIAGRVALSTARAATQKAQLPELAQRLQERESCVAAYQEAYRRYCWPVDGLAGVKLAPFQLLAAEGRTLLDRDHLWHVQTLARLARVSVRFIATEHYVLKTDSSENVKALEEWWDKKTEDTVIQFSIPTSYSSVTLRLIARKLAAKGLLD